jgi:CelD/BcsL family acetyltransferase involved in cellulose biosynthesis
MLDDGLTDNTLARPAPSDAASCASDARIATPYGRLVHCISPPDVRLEVHSDLFKVESEWRTFEKNAWCTVFQTFDWLAKWQHHIGRPSGVRPAIVMGRSAQGELLFILPLAIETKGFFRRLTWLGSELCDYNAPLLSERLLRHPDWSGFARLWRDIVTLIRKTSLASFHFIDLDKMPEAVGTGINPFLKLKALAHPCGAHIASLGENWEAYYTAKRSAATRKTERKQLRQLAQFGEVRLVAAQVSKDRADILDALIAQKSHWFARMGVKDIFARAGAKEFFMDVVTDPAMHDIVQVSKLSVGSTDAATSIELRFGTCYYLVLSSYQDGELARFGPGRVHLHKLMQHAILQGVRWFDFTVGDEPYKRDWSDIEVKLYDHLAAVTIRGRLAVMAIEAFRRTKRFIKRTPLLWRAYSTMRSLKGRWVSGAHAGAQSE